MKIAQEIPLIAYFDSIRLEFTREGVLTIIYINESELKNLESFSFIKGLKKLTVLGRSIESLRGIENATDLEYLHVGITYDTYANTNIKKIEHLETLTKLKILK